jgi:hypothetical protein
MFRFLSDFVLRYRLNKNLKQLAGVSKERFTHFKNIIILIPQEYEIEDQLFLKLSKELKVHKQDISIVQFGKNDVSEVSGKMIYKMNFSKKAISFWGVLNDDHVLFFDKKFDLLINYFDDKTLLPSYVSSLCKAKFRLGFSNADHTLNDLILTINPKDVDLFLSESIKYLRTIIK